MYFWICHGIFVIATHRIISLANQMGMYGLFATWNSVWLWLTSHILLGARPFMTAQAHSN